MQVCEMQFVPMQHAFIFEDAFTKQKQILFRFRKPISMFKIVHYWYQHESHLETEDKSYVLVTDYFPDGNLQTFGNIYYDTLRHQTPDIHEKMAVQSWCDLMESIALPLQTFDFNNITMKNVVVRQSDDMELAYNFYLTKLEEQPTANQQSESIKRLTLLGWQWYSKICNERVVFYACEEEKRIYARKDTNAFCAESKEIWGKNDIESVSKMKKILSISIGGDYRWRGTVQHKMATFVKSFCGYISKLLGPEYFKWDSFKIFLKKICYVSCQ